MLKVGFIETAPAVGVIMPIYMGRLDEESVKGRHIKNVIKTFRDVAIEDVEIYLLPNGASGFQRAIDLDLHIVNMSMDGVQIMIESQREALEKELSKKTLIITGAGNSGDKGETDVAQREEWLAVGSIDEKLNPRSYSSHGFGKVMTVAVDGMGGLYGTSFSAPRVAGLVTHYYKRFHDAFGYYPSPLQAREWIKFNSHDVFEDGWDLKTGYGLLKLPKRWEFSESVYTLGKEDKVVRKYVDGVITEKSVKTYAPFQIINDRSFVNPRDIVEDINGTTHWVQETRTVHFSR